MRVNHNISNGFEVLASKRPTTVTELNIGSAFMKAEPSVPMHLILENFKKAINSEKQALTLLNNLNLKPEAIKQQVYEHIQNYNKANQAAMKISAMISREIEPKLARDHRHKFLATIKDESLIDIPDYLKTNPESLFRSADELRRLHEEVSKEQNQLYHLQASGNILSDYPNLKTRLKQFRDLNSDSENRYLIEYLESRINCISDKKKLKERLDQFIYHSTVDQVSRFALYYGVPVDLAIGLVDKFIDTGLHNPFRELPLVDFAQGHKKLRELDLNIDPQLRSLLQPSHHIFSSVIPLQAIDAIRLAMMEQFPESDERLAEASFLKSLHNIDEAQNLVYEAHAITPKHRAPHFMGTGTWGELRAGIALIKIQDMHEKLYLNNHHNMENVPIIISQVIPCINKKYYDNAGVDFWIKMMDRKTKDEFFIPLQVKSSPKGVREHRAHGFKNPCVSLTKYDFQKQLEGHCLTALTRELFKELKSSKVFINKQDFKRLEAEFKENPGNEGLTYRLKEVLQDYRRKIFQS